MIDKEVQRMKRERWNLLVRIDSLLDVPMNALAFVWLILTVIDLVSGLNDIGELFVTIIWILFGVHFTLEFLLAPNKKTYLKHSWLTAISLILPAFRIFRVFRAIRGVRFLRGTFLIRIFGSINRGMKALSDSLGKKGFGYVLGVTCLVILAGAAGIMAFESSESTYFDQFGTALWWTCMMVTTMGADYFPKSPEGRLLALMLAIYGFAIFGYVTAAVASFFIEKEKASPFTGEAGLSELKSLRHELRELKDLVLRLEKTSSEKFSSK